MSQIEKKNFFTCESLLLAIIEKNLDKVKELLKAGVNPLCENNTPLVMATSFGYHQIVDEIIKYRNPYAIHERDLEALQLAVDMSDLAMIDSFRKIRRLHPQRLDISNIKCEKIKNILTRWILEREQLIEKLSEAINNNEIDNIRESLELGADLYDLNVWDPILTHSNQKKHINIEFLQEFMKLGIKPSQISFMGLKYLIKEPPDNLNDVVDELLKGDVDKDLLLQFIACYGPIKLIPSLLKAGANPIEYWALEDLKTHRDPNRDLTTHRYSNRYDFDYYSEISNLATQRDNIGDYFDMVNLLEKHSNDAKKIIKHEPIKEIKRMILFFASWCPHCKKLMEGENSPWSAFTHKYASCKDLIIEQIDYDKTPKIATQYGIYSFPTILLIKNDNTYIYDGDRSKESLVKFAREA